MIAIIMFTWLTIYMIATIEVVTKGEDGVHHYVLKIYRICKWIAILIMGLMIINESYILIHKFLL